MLSLEEAQARILSRTTTGGRELISLVNAAGRFLASDVASTVDLPGFDNSAMDGYAVRAEDVVRARHDAPVLLRQIGTTPAGESPNAVVTPGTCVRVFTGSPLPSGADAVVMQEDTRVEGDSVAVLDSAKPFENVRLRGEDLRAGEIVVRSGERISAAHIAVMAAAGVSQISVARQPVIGLLSTGTELCEPGQPLKPGGIYESNRPALAALITQGGGVARSYALVPDSLETTQQALLRALEECDAVVTTGGVSVGELDFVKAAFEKIGGVLDFWKVAIRPGKPFVLGNRAGKSLFGLPGNPVSAFVTFLLLVRPAILKMQGARSIALPSVPGVLRGAISNHGDRRHFVRVKMNDDGLVESAGSQASHRLKSLAESNGLLDVPPATTFEDGTAVRVLRWTTDR